MGEGYIDDYENTEQIQDKQIMLFLDNEEDLEKLIKRNDCINVVSFVWRYKNFTHLRKKKHLWASKISEMVQIKKFIFDARSINFLIR